METQDNIIEWIIAYCSGNISAKEKNMLEDWVESSPRHAEEFKEIARSYHKIAITARWKEIDMPKQKIWQTINRLRKKRNDTIKKAIAFAAIIALLLGGGYAMFYATLTNHTTPEIDYGTLQAQPGKTMAVLELASGEQVQLRAGEEKQLHTTEGILLVQDPAGKIEYKKQADQLSATTSYNTIKVPEGGEYHIILGDGTQVWLNSASELRFPVLFSATKREIFLKGEACFNVSANPENPFIVTTDDATVTVLGTSFNVTAYPEDRQMEVALLTGKVNFSPRNAQEYTLTPGHTITLEKSSKQVTIEKKDVESIAAWRSGIFYFENMPLDELFVKLKRWYQTPFTFHDKTIGKMCFTGAITKYRNLEYILNMISKTQELRFKREGDQIIVYKNSNQ